MVEQSTYAVAIRWLLYGAIVGIVVGVGKFWGTNVGQDWQSAAGPVLATVIEFAIVGMLIGIFRHHLANRRP